MYRYGCDVIVNGKIVCRTENMFISDECEINGLKKSGNEILVHVYPNEIAARSYYSPAMCFAQKYSYPALGLRRSPAYYGWDIFPRLACGGILGDIFLYKATKVFICLRGRRATRHQAIISIRA